MLVSHDRINDSNHNAALIDCV